ncbi:MAG: hypothetical protein OEL68_10345, partial [Desulfobulbaceae bacterium]|nr:hypothetical protein [Desulfobulbaceae bacterium]
QQLEAQKQQLEEEYTRSLESTCMACEIKAQKEVTDVNEMVENLQNITDDILQDIVRVFLQDILPAEKR